LSAQRHVPIGTGFAPVHLLLDDRDGHRFDEGHGAPDLESHRWDGSQRKAHELKPLAGDTVGEAFWINDNGVAVGTTGHCSDTQLPPFAGGAHAVLWDKYGTPHDLGGFGERPTPQS
jgi:hypothetical protein